MSRYLTEAEYDLLASGDGFLTKARFRVKNFLGDWIDLSAIDSGSRTLRMFVSCTITDDVDRNTLSMNAVVKREAGAAYSLSPFRSDSVLNDAGDGTFAPLLDLHREWAIDAVFYARGVTPTLPDDYREVKSGFIDSLDESGSQNTITLQGYGPEKDLIDRRILFVDRTATPLVQITEATPKVYAGGVIGDVLQAILDEEMGVGVVPLTLAASAPSTYIDGWTQTTSVGLFELLSQIAGIGAANLRYLYDSSDVLTLTLFTPPRNKTDPDWEISGNMQLETLDVGIGLEPVRNFAVVRYMDSAGVIQTVTSPATPASASITRYGERPIEIDLSADTKVNDATRAQALADAVNSDWELPYMQQQGTAHGLWFAELHDLVRTKATGIQYDEDQDGAIVGYTMTLANRMLANAFAFSGKVKGRYATWLQFGGTAGALPVAPALVSLSATFEELPLNFAWVPFVAVVNETTQSVFMELAEDVDFTTVINSAAYPVIGGQASGAMGNLAASDRDKVYFVRATPYSGPVVTFAVTGTAGQYAIANTLVHPVLVDSATATINRSATGEVSVDVVTGSGSSVAPASADYLVKTANAGLSAERVVTDTSTIAADWATAGQAKLNVVDGSLGVAKLSATGTPSSTTFLRGDNTWAASSGGLALPTPVTKGDIYYAASTGATVLSRLPIGTPGQVLFVDGDLPAWGTLSSGAVGGPGTGFLENDYFDYGSSIDTTGARFTSAIAWTILNARTGTNAVASSQLTVTPALSGNNWDPWIAVQPLSASIGVWRCQTDGTTSPTNNYQGLGIILRESSTGKMLAHGHTGHDSGQITIDVKVATSFTNWTGGVGTSPSVATYATLFEVSRFGTTWAFRYSTNSGSTWTTIASGVAEATYFTSAPDQIGIWVNSEHTASSARIGIFPKFERIS